MSRDGLLAGMSTEVKRLSLNSAQYEAVTAFISVVVGGLGVPFYMEATAGSGWKNESSSIAANVLGTILFTKGSIDYLYGLIQKKEYGKAAAIVLISAVLYAPQVLIAVMESNASLNWTVFAAVSTGLSGAFTSAYAVSSVPSLLQSAKASINEQFFSQATDTQKRDKTKILANLDALIARVRVSNYRSILGDERIDGGTRQELLEIAVRLAQSAPQPCVENAGYLPSAATGLLGLAFMLLLQYGTLFSYHCATEKSLRNDVKAPPMVAFIACFALLSFQYLLNFTGGVGVARGLVDTLSLPNFKRLLPNEKTLGGMLGMLFAIIAPILGFLSAAYSGKPTKEFSKTCESSVLQPALFPGYGDVADYASRFFNAIFAAKFFYWLHTFAVERCGNEQDNNFRFVLNALQSLRAEAAKTPADKVSELFTRDDAARLGADVRTAAATDSSAVPMPSEAEQSGRNSPIAIADGVMTLAKLTQDKKAFVSEFFKKEVLEDASVSDTASLATRLI